MKPYKKRKSITKNVLISVLITDLLFLFVGLPVLMNYEDHFSSDRHRLYALSNMTSTELIVFTIYIFLWIVHLAGILYLGFFAYNRLKKHH